MAFEALCAQEDVPKREPVILLEADIMEAVIDVVTLSELREAFDPDVISFFQFGISTFYYGWLQYCPLPFRANNIDNKYMKKYYCC